MTGESKLFPRFINHIAYKVKNLTGAKLDFMNESHSRGCNVLFQLKNYPVLKLRYLPFNGQDGRCVKVSLSEYEEKIVTTPKDAWEAVLTLTNEYGGGKEIFAQALNAPDASITGMPVPLAGEYMQPIDRTSALESADLYLLDQLGLHYWDEYHLGKRGRGCLGDDFVYLRAYSDVERDIVRAEMIAPTVLQLRREGFSDIFHFNTLSTPVTDVVAKVEQLSKLAAANGNVA